MTLGRSSLASALHDVIERQASDRNSVCGDYKAADITPYNSLSLKLRRPLYKAGFYRKLR
jgi:hypothetical protein